MRLSICACLISLTAGSWTPGNAQDTVPLPRARAAEPGAFQARGVFVDVSISRYTLRSEIIDGTAAMPVVGAGFQVSPRFSLRVESTLRPLDFARTRHARFVLRSGDASVEAVVGQLPRDELERLWPETDLEVQRHVRFVASALAGFHGELGRRVRMGWLAGLTFQREGSFERREDPTLLDFSPRYAFTTQTQEWTRTQVLLATGLDADVRLTAHLSAVAQLRFDFGRDANDPDDGIVITRPGVALRWAF